LEEELDELEMLMVDSNKNKEDLENFTEELSEMEKTLGDNDRSLMNDKNLERLREHELEEERGDDNFLEIDFGNKSIPGRLSLFLIRKPFTYKFINDTKIYFEYLHEYKEVTGSFYALVLPSLTKNVPYFKKFSLYSEEFGDDDEPELHPIAEFIDNYVFGEYPGSYIENKEGIRYITNVIIIVTPTYDVLESEKDVGINLKIDVKYSIYRGVNNSVVINNENYFIKHNNIENLPTTITLEYLDQEKIEYLSEAEFNSAETNKTELLDYFHKLFEKEADGFVLEENNFNNDPIYYLIEKKFLPRLEVRGRSESITAVLSEKTFLVNTGE
jgi:hypothetical protein